ncbi:MAG: protein-L-isoaspartate(D-aspartate) O-methyltransferase [Chitinophagaceae bacterium]|nr:protein-L-isoaspartate(D-aspartate) O-methyltransferase [Chitinophagaceae bacterium]
MREYKDTYQHKGLRQQLVNQLRQKGINNEQILEAINSIPRHYFLDSAFDKIAYQDKAFPISAGQTISQPYTVAYQTQLLGIKKGDKVLEIGTGSAYQACVLAELGVWVYTIERQKSLFDLQKNFLYKNKYLNLKFFYGDGFLGLPRFAPYNKIIVTAAAPYIPPALTAQLKPGGLLVIPVDDAEGDAQRMLRITKNLDESISEEVFEHFSFVPMLGGKNS